MENNEESLHPNWVALATVPFQRKVFIKASEAIEAHEKAKKDEIVRKRQLEGSEAKKFYQSVLNEPSTSTEPIQRPKIQFKVKKANLQTKVKFRESDLLKAVEIDDLEFVSQVISSHPEMKDFKDNFGWSLLMIASKAGSEKVLHFLKGQNADLHITDKTGQDCISLAKNKTIKAILTGPKDQKAKVKTSKPKKSLTNLNCELCNVEGLDEDQYKAHLSSTIHQYKEASNKDLKVHYVIPEANRGFQMMLQSGWESNKGLGPQKDGKLYPVKTALKRNKHGLGLEKTEKKVTHFQSFDDTSVKNPKKDERVERAQTMKKRLKDKHKCKQIRKEVDFRREFM